MVAHRPRVAYVVSRFPKITETFILYEILELQRIGFDIDIFALVHEKGGIAHPEAAMLEKRGTYGDQPMAIAAAQFYWLLRRPRAYFGAWLGALVGNVRSPKFLVRAAVTVAVAAFFARQMRSRDAQHIHAHWATHPTLAAWVASRLLNLPYSFTTHAHDLYVERSMLRQKVDAARFVVTISEFNRRFIERLYGALAAKVEVIHCGVDLEVFEPAPNQASETWTIVSVASLQPQKGHLNLIRACGLLRDQGIALRCLLIGEGPEEASLRAETGRLGLNDLIEFRGALPRDQVIAALHDAHAAVLASVRLPGGKMEGIPVSLMEAMAMRIPVVATQISGIPELVRDGETGLLVEERDPEGLAAALRRLHEDPALANRLAEAGRALVEGEFNLKVNTARLGDRFTATIASRLRD